LSTTGKSSMSSNKLFKVIINLSGQVYTYYTQSEREVSARLNIARRLERRLGLITGALTSRLLADTNSVKVEAVNSAQTGTKVPE
jgi:hypothetical protein